METNWRDNAACKGRTNLFFAPRGEREQRRNIRVAQAHALCALCPVKAPCSEAALGEHGIWAGGRDDEFVLNLPAEPVYV